MLGSIRQTATVASSALRRTVSAVPRRTLATASASVSSKFARGSSARWFGLAAAATAAAVVVATQTEPIAAAAAEPGLNAKEFVPLKLVKVRRGQREIRADSGRAWEATSTPRTNQ